MGTTRTPTYRAEVFDQSGRHLQLWDVRRHGRPTAENAEKLRRSLNESFQPGGVNAHIRIRFGKVEAIPHVNRVLVVRQRDGVAVAAARMPAFEVI